MITLESLKEDFRNIGIKAGDTLFLRISYKAVGKVEGGPMTFLKALHEVVGEDGTIILTAFPKRYISQFRYFHHEVYSYSCPPKSVTGAMSITAMSYPGARLSRKLEFPFVVIGKQAEYLTENHSHDKSDYWLLEQAIEKFDCKCLRVGGKKFTGSTHIAFSRVLKRTNNYQIIPKTGLYINENNKVVWYESQHSVFCPRAFFYVCDKFIWPNINLKKGFIGGGEAMLTDMRETLYWEEMCMSKNISIMLCDDKDCFCCRTSYSFSHSTVLKYVVFQVRNLFSKRDKKKVLIRIGKSLEYAIFGKKTC